jgi:hypothetical protein
MEKQIYLIRTYQMHGATFKTWQLAHFEESDFIIKDNSIRFKIGGMPMIYSLSFNKEGIEYDENSLLDYMATVTEDIPAYLKIKPESYKNCQLMMETHGGYLQFKDLDTGEKYRIAVNSNYYVKN